MSLARRILRIVRLGLLGAGLLVVTVMFSPLVSWWATKLAGPWPDPKGEILIVLTGSNLESGIIGYSSYWRSVYALLAYRRGGWERIVISGDGPGDPPTAEAMRTFLVAGGVPVDMIQLETESRTTWESACRLSQLLAHQTGTKVLLTSDLHMFRARRMFLKAGLDVVPHPIPDARRRALQWPLRWWVFLDLLRETTAIGYYWIHGQI